MSQEQPAPSSPARLFLPLAGAAALGVIAFANFLAFGSSQNLVVGALVLAVVVVTVGVITFRRATLFAWGWLGGYAVLTLISGGSCTLFLTSGGEAAGFFGYPILLFILAMGSLVVVVIRLLRARP